jgi:hypothetical protein
MNGDEVRSKNGAFQADDNLPSWLKLTRQQVETLKFGTVQITVHDRKVVQIDRHEKTRIDGAH